MRPENVNHSDGDTALIRRATSHFWNRNNFKGLLPPPSFGDKARRHFDFQPSNKNTPPSYIAQFVIRFTPKQSVMLFSFNLRTLSG